MIKNKWEIRYEMNQHSKFIMEFLEFSDCKTLDDLVNLEVDDIVKLMDEYEEHLKLIHTTSTRLFKIRCVEKFYLHNGFSFK